MTKQTRFGWALSIALLAGTQVTVLAQDQNATAQATGGSTTTAPQNTMKPGGVTGKDLTISAAKSASHTMLFRALRVSGLTDQASGKGPYTVFAPTNDAFDKLPTGTFDELMKPAAKSKLVKVLAYHVVKGKLKAADLQDGQKLKTLTGGTLTVNKEGETVTIVDGAGNSATINQADIEATNGVVHSVDSVLMPAGGK
ncbi:fasciclin domain-containing protein [Spirosoma utsteinense]|uniref:Surface protein n=1 Tax=Spirosoma utsteinense TaxID=2585773 RepID=A0ABR6VZE1_9BACT|nr:fasciclin domain-containing protein [Spirosoma utsteinense]MBC3784552.1 putative surface protein [Spirosoma utsteinense]MBC3789697.1 putative surface protein [Spirosoma utsteinense]